MNIAHLIVRALTTSRDPTLFLAFLLVIGIGNLKSDSIDSHTWCRIFTHYDTCTSIDIKTSLEIKARQVDLPIFKHAGAVTEAIRKLHSRSINNNLVNIEKIKLSNEPEEIKETYLSLTSLSSFDPVNNKILFVSRKQENYYAGSFDKMSHFFLPYIFLQSFQDHPFSHFLTLGDIRSKNVQAAAFQNALPHKPLSDPATSFTIKVTSRDKSTYDLITISKEYYYPISVQRKSKSGDPILTFEVQTLAHIRVTDIQVPYPKVSKLSIYLPVGLPQIVSKEPIASATCQTDMIQFNTITSEHTLEFDPLRATSIFDKETNQMFRVAE